MGSRWGPLRHVVTVKCEAWQNWGQLRKRKIGGVSRVSNHGGTGAIRLAVIGGSTWSKEDLRRWPFGPAYGQQSPASFREKDGQPDLGGH